jgi:rubrerythrin
MQYELDMYHFYRLSIQRTQDEELRGVLEELYHKEQDHIEELEEKYHVHLDPELRSPTIERDKLLSGWIFEGIDFDDASGHVVQLYDKAIEMERRTRDYFRGRADAMPPGPEREIYRELAAEEEEHVAILETERAQFAEE